MQIDANRALHERYIEELNRGNFAFLDEYLAPDYVMHGARVEIQGAEAFREYVVAMTGAFSDLERRAEDIIVSGDRVVTRWSGTARHTGSFSGIPPTNRDVTITGIIISRIAGGKVVEEWEQIDRLGACWNSSARCRAELGAAHTAHMKRSHAATMATSVPHVSARHAIQCLGRRTASST